MDELIKHIYMDCPNCGKRHNVEVCQERVTTMFENRRVTYNEKYYRCLNVNADKRNFLTAKMMDVNKQAMLKAYNESKISS